MGWRTKPDLAGQVVVTGANAGIGKETAVALAAMGATVVMTARNPDKGADALADVRRRSGSDQVELGELDLGSFASVRAFAATLLDRHTRLNILINNAGLVTDTRRETAEGFEEMFGVNHLGHVLLIALLQDRLVASAPARVVVLSSVAHRLAVGGLNRSDLQGEHPFEGFTAYARSKLANLQFARELARRLDGTGVTVNAVHPGAVNSHFGRDGDTGLGHIVKYPGWLVLRSPKGGAKTTVLVASSAKPRVTTSTGGYWSHGFRCRPSKAARNDGECRWLWDESARLIAAVS